jgi:hypothetical protein
MTFTGSTTITGTSTTIVTCIACASTSITATTMPPGSWGVPGFPIESILAGLLGGLIALTIVRRRRRPQLPTP